MEKKPAVPPALVADFVNVAHGDFDRIKAMFEQEPALLSASWDWGGWTSYRASSPLNPPLPRRPARTAFPC